MRESLKKLSEMLKPVNEISAGDVSRVEKIYDDVLDAAEDFLDEPFFSKDELEDMSKEEGLSLINRLIKAQGALEAV